MAKGGRKRGGGGPAYLAQIKAQQRPEAFLPQGIDEQTLTRALALAKADYEQTVAHPWFAVSRGWVMTQDEKPPVGVSAIRPMPTLEYLRAVTELWVESPKGLLGKTRQLMVSWLFAWLTYWDAAYHQGRHSLIQGKRLEDVHAANPHAILGRVRFIRQHMPPFLQPKVLAENTTSETYANGSTIEAIPEGEDIIRGKVPSTMFMDEIAFHETAESNWNNAVPSAGKMWGVTTPNGHEFMYRQSDPGRSWDDWRNWPAVIPGVHSYQNKKGIQLVFLHWSADPERTTPEAQAARREGYTNVRDYMREQEGDFTLVQGLGVFANEFSINRHVIQRYQPDPLSPIYRGWDTGYNGQSVGFFQFNADGQLVWFDHIILKAVPLARVAQEAKRRILHWVGSGSYLESVDPLANYNEPQVMDYGDPAARQHNADGESDAALLSKFGIRLVTKTTTGRKMDLVESVRQLLLPRNDGKPALLIAKNTPEMDHVIAGFAGGYHWAKPKDGKAEKALPEKDGFYDHIFDAGQYAVDNISPIRFTSYVEPGEMATWWRIDEPGVGNADWVQ